jgi:cell wall-associated NlpC family hydrolase
MSKKDVKVKPKITPKSANKSLSPKTDVKNKESVTNAVKDVKTVMRDTAIREAIDSSLERYGREEQPQKADTEAAESVENTAYISIDTVYQKGKASVQSVLNKHNANKVKTREQAENNPPVSQNHSEPNNFSVSNTPKSKEPQPKIKENTKVTAKNTDTLRTNSQRHTVKTKAEYLKSKREFPHQAENSPKGINIKTKENYVKEHHKEPSNSRITGQKEPYFAVKGKNDTNSVQEKTQPKTDMNMRREYVTNKLKKNAENERAEIVKSHDGVVDNKSEVKADNTTPNMPKTRESYITEKKNNEPDVRKIHYSADNKVIIPEQTEHKVQVKTKESYLEQLKQERIEPKQLKLNTPKQNTHTVSRGKTKIRQNVKMRKTEKRAVKNGSIYSKNAIKKKTAKATKQAVKTQKEVTKKASKEAAKRTKELAQRTAQIAKATAKAVTKIAVKVAQVVAQATAKLISALVAAGGWAVLIVVLIVVIIIAALAASPFGIFISDEVAEAGTIPLSQIRAECNVELTQEVENIELSVSHDDVDVIDNQADWNEIISVFAVKTAGTDDNTAEDVVVFDTAKAEKLKNVFRAANTVSYTTSSYTDAEGNTKIKLIITITGKTKDELIVAYLLTAKQKEAVETLLEHGDILTSSSHSLAITDATVQGIISGLSDSLPQKRKDVVKNAASLVGKVNYFWGGKSSAIGWDSAWGVMRKVTAAGSPSSDSIRAFGLDCSGFVTWVFNNSGMSLGYGTSGQKAASTLVSAASVQAGDIVFVSDYSHVGIVVGRDASGNILVIHCSSGANNVVLATASSVGFNIFKRPNCY